MSKTRHLKGSQSMKSLLQPQTVKSAKQPKEEPPSTYFNQRKEELQRQALKEKDFVDARVKKDSLFGSVCRAHKTNNSVYEVSYHLEDKQVPDKASPQNLSLSRTPSVSTSQLNKDLAGKIIASRESRYQKQYPSLYKKSAYEDQYLKHQTPAPEKAVDTNSHQIFSKNTTATGSTYQLMYGNSGTETPHVLQPILPPPAAYFVKGLRFKGDSQYGESYVTLPKISNLGKGIGNTDHLNHLKLGKEVFCSEYKENFEEKVQPSRLNKIVPKENNHFFPDMKKSISKQHLKSDYKTNFM